MAIRDLLINGGLMLAAAWLLAGVTLIVFARTLIYPFQSGFSVAEPVGVPGARSATLAAADGTALTVWLAEPDPGKPVAIYFMGNGGALPSHAPLLAALAEAGIGVAALNYRGAGGAPGKPSQAALTADALTLYDRLDDLIGSPVPAARRILYGTSLGAALAVQLAAERPSRAVVLESPFNRLCEVAEFHYPVFPACLVLPYERWDSAARIAEIGAPLLILHGEDDPTIPASQGRALFAAAREPKRLMTYPGAGHNDLFVAGAGADAVAFIDAITGGPGS